MIILSTDFLLRFLHKLIQTGIVCAISAWEKNYALYIQLIFTCEERVQKKGKNKIRAATRCCKVLISKIICIMNSIYCIYLLCIDCISFFVSVRGGDVVYH
mmetsp:Transcript_26361/g.86644  ORF Transcript_26361/g.86644 Transcript_26361/m.86644 type:complete len:101 (-) Transcript_26361:715-1017(-)